MTQPIQGELFAETTVSTATPLFADIVFDRPLDHAYTYSVPGALQAELAVGKRVVVPFGKGDRATVGFCVGLSQQKPTREVKEVRRVVDESPLLTTDLLRLTRWMADYYLCAWGQVLNAVVPAGVKRQAGTRNVLFLEAVPEMLQPKPTPKLSPKQKAALELLCEHGKPMEPRTLGHAVKCGMGPLLKLVDKGMARKIVRRLEHRPDSEEEPPLDLDSRDVSDGLVLTEDQRQAWEVLEPAMQTGGFQPFLLYGVTGSGKTELYMRAIAEVIRQGKEALILVPEISLTPQTIRRFRGRFGNVAVLHSNLLSGERGGHWRRIAAGQVQVIVGARSAVFAPTRRLGLIVIDEEHETSFKQDMTPRYHARDVAVMRARLENIPILLGSATPSLESWYNAQRGQYQLLKLPKRVLDLPLPHIGLIDLRHDRPVGAPWKALSPALERTMQQALVKGGQIMLLLNRRGYSTYIHCPACGHVEFCKFCDLGLTFHRERDVLLCHYCGYETPPPDRCPVCGEGQVRYQGLGTEKLQAEIESKFPDRIVRRMDSDTMRRPGSHKRVLDDFRKGEVNILLGTQMIAKGLDFPNVTLVGVVNADMGLHHADFRAAERTFQLLAQVSGRTGRGPRGGRVLIQTFSPEHPSIALAATHAFERFAAEELANRRAHLYPPYQRLARLIVRSRNQEHAREWADRLAGAFRQAMNGNNQREADGGEAPSLRLLGPAEAPVFRLKGYYRFHFQLQSASSGFLHKVLRQVVPVVRPPKGVELTIDIDPQDML